MGNLSENQTLQHLYSGLASPRGIYGRSPLSRVASRSSSPVLSACHSPKLLPKPKLAVEILPYSNIPTPLMTPTEFSESPMNLRMINKKLESLSRNRNGQLPILEHLLNEEGSRPLSLAADENRIYVGPSSESNAIIVYSRDQLQKQAMLLGHEGSILALLLVPEKKWLFSGSSDGTVRIWCTETLSPLCDITPSSGTSGDIYCLSWDPRAGGTLYFGDQSTDIEYVNFGRSKAELQSGYFGTQPVKVTKTRSSRVFPHKFFSEPRPGSPAFGGSPRSSVRNMQNTPLLSPGIHPAADVLPEELSVPLDNVVSSAHYGYVYCMQMIQRPDDTWWLASGSGDADVKMWECQPGGGLEYLFTFNELPGATLSLTYRDSLLFAGIQGGQIKVWDLETRSCIRSILAHNSDVMSMAIAGTELYAAGADGMMMRFDSSFDCTATFQAHQFSILSTLMLQQEGGQYSLISAGKRFVKLWNLPRGESAEVTPIRHDANNVTPSNDGDVMLYGISKMIAIPTVSDGKHSEDCRQGAHLLKRLVTQMGAEAQLLPTMDGKNPLVLAKFQGQSVGKPRKRVLFYGHYDVQPATEEEWATDPFELSGRNGYLYGRGVADNKGPILAVACAAAALRERRMLDVDLVMVIEGEEEAGSAGFIQAMRKYRDDIGHIDTILLSNSSWVGEDDPCVVFGLRGVIYANLSITSKNADAHSGVDGGAVAEPMLAMVKLLSNIENGGKVNIPGFYDGVSPLGEEEQRYYEAVAKVSDMTVETIAKKWREPTFSVANIRASGPANNTIIPNSVTANVSFRLVPDQDLDTIVGGLKKHCNDVFSEMQNGMALEINVTHRARWWLAHPENAYFQTLERAIEKIWKQKPLRIREGGSIPTIPFLEELFNAPCVHLPIGQHSSNAHLSNERLRLLNLRNGKKVIEEFLINVAKIEPTVSS